MRSYVFKIISLIVLSGFMPSAVFASDIEREKRLADQIVDALLDGEAVYLEANGQTFLSIYTEADDAKGTAIILHGRGFHPDWPDAINPIRVGLVESGWNTLSVQMPVLEKQAKYYDYLPLFPQAIPRIEAAIAYARERAQENAGEQAGEQGKEKGKSKVVLIAHSCGAHMAMTWADTESFESIDAYVGIGMGATDYKQPMKRDLPLEKLTVPVLDVYAERDFPAVLKMAEKRWSSIKAAGNEKSRQVVVDDAEHYYVDRGDALTAVISEWLDTL
jgi:alpha/beta superfamily hydrolase